MVVQSPAMFVTRHGSGRIKLPCASIFDFLSGLTHQAPSLGARSVASPMRGYTPMCVGANSQKAPTTDV